MRPSSADVVIMAAAVADYTPASPASRKDRQDRRPADADAAAHAATSSPTSAPGERPRDATRPVLVGFAAETDDLLREGAREARAQGASI